MTSGWVSRYGVPLAVLGDPIEHTLSPPIHNSAFERAGLSHRYHALQVPAEDFEPILDSLIEARFLGLNFTVPHKERATKLVDKQNSEVRQLQAANTLYWEDEGPRLANTDVYGFKQLIQPWEDRIRSEPVLVLGAGGAAKACLLGLQQMEAADVFIWNRTHSRAQQLRDQFPELGVEVLDESHWPGGSESGLVVNATSLGLKPEDPSPFPQSEIQLGLIGVDLNYGSPTKFLNDFQQYGETARDGLDMLLHQAARAWELWMGDQPDLEAMDSAARQSLESSP